MRRGSIGATERSGFAVAAIERIVRLLAMHDTVGIVVPPTPPERCNLAFVAGSGVLPVLRGKQPVTIGLQTRYTRVVPALYPLLSAP